MVKACSWVEFDPIDPIEYIGTRRGRFRIAFIGMLNSFDKKRVYTYNIILYFVTLCESGLEVIYVQAGKILLL